MVFVPHRLAQLRNGGGERAIHHHHVGPDRLQQFLFGDDLPGMKKKLKQNLQRLRFELYRLAFRAQFTAQFVKFVVGETPKASRGFFYIYCRFLVIHEVSASLEFLRIPSGHERVS